MFANIKKGANKMAKAKLPLIPTVIVVAAVIVASNMITAKACTPITVINNYILRS